MGKSLSVHATLILSEICSLRKLRSEPFYKDKISVANRKMTLHLHWFRMVRPRVTPVPGGQKTASPQNAPQDLAPSSPALSWGKIGQDGLILLLLSLLSSQWSCRAISVSQGSHAISPLKEEAMPGTYPTRTIRSLAPSAEVLGCLPSTPASKGEAVFPRNGFQAFLQEEEECLGTGETKGDH